MVRESHVRESSFFFHYSMLSSTHRGHTQILYIAGYNVQFKLCEYGFQTHPIKLFIYVL